MGVRVAKRREEPASACIDSLTLHGRALRHLTIGVNPLTLHGQPRVMKHGQSVHLTTTQGLAGFVAHTDYGSDISD